MFPRLFLLIAFTIIASCKKKEGESPARPLSSSAPRAISVQTLIAAPEFLNSEIEVPGSIMANESTEIRSEISGRLVKLNLREGANVAQGALIAKLYDGDLQAQMRKLEVQLKIAEQTEKDKRNS